MRLSIATIARGVCGHPWGFARWLTIPDPNLGEVLGERKVFVRWRAMKTEEGMLPPEQSMVLLSLLVAENPAEVLEIGTFMGHTTRAMAENLAEATIHTVDLPESFVAATDAGGLPKDDFHLIARRTVGREFSRGSFGSQIVQHRGDTAHWNFAEAGKPTFFFIDGSHTYEHCKNDSEKCLAVCGGNGVFLWHDCDETHPGVVRFVTEWRQQGRDIVRIRGTSLAFWRAGTGTTSPPLATRSGIEQASIGAAPEKA